MILLDILTRHVSEIEARLIFADLCRYGVFRRGVTVIDGEWTVDPQGESEKCESEICIQTSDSEETK